MPVALETPAFDAPEGFTVKARILDPEQIISTSYGPAYDEHGNEREPTPEEDAELEAWRTEVREHQLHRFRVSLFSISDQTTKVLQSHLFPPDEAPQAIKDTQAVVTKVIQHKVKEPA